MKNWNKKWFGYWKEHNLYYTLMPSVFDYVAENYFSSEEKEKIVKYLKSGISLSATSAYSFNNPFSGKHQIGSIFKMTDGEWIWLSDLTEYIEKNNVILPLQWLEKIRAQNYQVVCNLDDPKVKDNIKQASLDLASFF